MTSHPTASSEAWAMVDRENRRDRLIKRVSVTAWAVTFVCVLAYGAMFAIQIVTLLRRVEFGVATMGAVFQATLPLLYVLGVLSLLIAVLSTVGMFFRLRTASLSELRLRLGSLEDTLRQEVAQLAERLDYAEQRLFRPGEPGSPSPGARPPIAG